MVKSVLITVMMDGFISSVACRSILTRPIIKNLFRLHTLKLINSGACRSIDIIRTFGIPKSNVMRSLRQLREKGADSFFEPRTRRQGGTLLTPDVLQQAQHYLDQGMTPREAADELAIKADTLRKAISDGRLKKSLI